MSALIPSYSADNRVVESSLSVSYFRKVVQGKWVGTTAVESSASVTYTAMYEYHRVARKVYKYVGMTEAAAKDCAAAKISTYTRTVRYQKWNETGSSGGTMGAWEWLEETASEMSADIAARHVAGSMWEVSISVNEDSVCMAKTDEAMSYATMFAQERQRSYDGETEV